MPWVHFTRDFNFTVTPAVTIAYRAGMVEFVHRRCAGEAVAKDRGRIVGRPAGRKASKGNRNGKA